MTRRERHKLDIKPIYKINPDTLPKLPGLNDYDKFDLDFLKKENGKVFNYTFDVTNVPDKLYGVPTGLEEVNLVDYLVYRPIPDALLKWRDIPDYHRDSLDMESWYRELIDYCKHGVWLDGEYWNPYMVYWLNVFVFPVPKKDEDGNIIPDFDPGHPFYCNIDRYILDLAWKARMTGQDVSLMGSRGIGKALDVNELVPTVNGYKRMGDLTLEDRVFGKEGNPIDILAIYDHKDKDLYNVTLKDGREIIACNEHLWGVYDHKDFYTTKERHAPTKRYPKGRLKKKRGVYKVLETQEILAEGLTFSSREDSRWYIPMQEAVEFPGKGYSIMPYTLGVLLGDGCLVSNTPTITNHPDDCYIIERVNEEISDLDCAVSNRKRDIEFGIVGTNGHSNNVAISLRTLGLQGTKSYNKFIPEEYLLGSIKQRTDLLHGLMDTDGYCTKSGTPQYCTVSDRLKNGFVQLCASLGIRAEAVKKKTKSDHGYAWTITLKTNVVVFSLSRKRERQKLIPGNNWVESIHTRVPIVSIESVGKGDARCITVDSKDHLFQATKNHIVTHNSYLFGNIMDREYRLFPNSSTIVSSSSEDLTSEAWDKVEKCLTAIEKLHPALKHKRITNSLTAKYSGEIVELPDGTIEERGYLSKFEKIIYGKQAGKTRGRRPTVQLIEEFAAFPPSKQKGDLKSCMRESRGSWYVGGSIKKCTVHYSGTGGTVENDQAEGIFLDPIANECIPTWDWEEAGDKGCGIFIPIHIKRSGTWEDTGCPDIQKGYDETIIEREKRKSDPIGLMGLLQEFPMNLEEVFMRKGVNIFNQELIAHQRAQIQFKEGIPKPGKGNLKWKKSEAGTIIGVEWIPSNVGSIEILEHPHWTQDIEDLPDDERQPIKNLYVGGCDSIDQGIGDSAHATDSIKGSELCIMIKKRIVDKGYLKYTSNIYVAKYNKRSKDVRTDWDNALKLAYYYNAEVNIEYTKIGIVGWFRDKGFYHLLKKRPSIALQGGNPNKATTLIGTQASTPVIDHMDQKLAHYIDDYYTDIFFPDVLDQLRKYDRENRTKFDMVIAMGLAELADEDLMGKVAKPPEKASDGYEDFGYYTCPETGYKKFGVIPKASEGKKEMERILEETREFERLGGVRWIDASDPTEQKLHWSNEEFDGPHY